MAVLGLLGFALLMGLMLLPQYWIRRVDKKYGDHRSDLPGTGGELAKHLIEHFGIDGVRVEATPNGAEYMDHYDPIEKVVRLSPSNLDGTSITTVAVAAHEVAHAMQDFDGQNGRNDGGMKMRHRLVSLTQYTDKFASAFFLLSPFFGLLARTPVAFIGLILIGVGLLAIRVLVHLLTLPVELDASFKRALPILEEGGYLHEDDLPAARSVLKAAAFTYVAGAVRSLVDVAQWIRILR